MVNSWPQKRKRKNNRLILSFRRFGVCGFAAESGHSLRRGLMRGSRNVGGTKRRRPPPCAREFLSLPGSLLAQVQRYRFELNVICWPGSQGFSATAEGACPPHAPATGVFPVTLIIGREATGFRKNRGRLDRPPTMERTCGPRDLTDAAARPYNPGMTGRSSGDLRGCSTRSAAQAG
jgi:hypothetical protein